VCVAYEFEGKRFEEFPPNQTIFNKAKPVFEEFAGWEEDITEARELDDLPKEARSYLEGLESLVGTPVSWASVGPEREQIVRFRQP
jgi:adenylosuccinate synthase